MIHLVVCEGRRVRDPKTKKVIGKEGVHIEEISTYWFRRIQDGDVKIAAEAKASASEKPAAQPKKTAKEKGD